MANRFRTPMLRDAYDAAMLAFESKHRNLFHADGARNTLNAVGMMFWRGYDGTIIGRGFSDASSRSTSGYATWRAGHDARKASQK